MLRYVLMFTLFCLTSTSVAKIFSKCELVYELRRLGYAENEMKNLVCLIDMFRSRSIGGPDPYSSYDYELLQVNDHYWCNTGPFAGRGCNVPCTDLMLDDITIAASCAKSLLSHRSRGAWYVWEIFCRGFRLPEHGC